MNHARLRKTHSDSTIRLPPGTNSSIAAYGPSPRTGAPRRVIQLIRGSNMTRFLPGAFFLIRPVAPLVKFAVAAEAPTNKTVGAPQALNNLPLAYAVFHNSEWSGPQSADRIPSHPPVDARVPLMGYHDLTPAATTHRDRGRSALPGRAERGRGSTDSPREGWIVVASPRASCRPRVNVDLCVPIRAGTRCHRPPAARSGRRIPRIHQPAPSKRAHLH